MSTLTSKLIIELTDRLTAPLKNVNAALKRVNDMQARNNAQLDAVRGRMLETGAVAYGLARAIASPIKAATEFENSMLGVAKQMDGARDAHGKLTPAYYEMGKAIQKLARVTPIATNDLADMVTAGLRMGVAKDEVLKFVEETAKMSTAFEMPAAELADSMGKIASLYKIPIPAISSLGDVINYLDDNTISTGSGIIEYLTRVGGVAGAVKITSNDMAAFGSTLLSLGERTETAGTATNAMIQKFAAATKGTKKFQSAMKEIGLSAEAVEKGMQQDAFETMLTVMDAVNKLPATARIGVLSELVGLEHADTLAKLVTQTDELRRQRDLANSSAAKGSMDREYQARLQTTQAQWEMISNRAKEVGVAVGSALLPALNQFMGTVGPIITKMAEWAEAHPALTRAVVGLAAGLVGLRVAALAAQFSFLWMKGSVLSAAAVGLRGVGKTIGVVSSAFRRMRAAMVGAQMLGAVGGGGIFSKIVAGVAAVATGISAPILAIIAGIAAVGLAVYNYWVPIKEFVSGFVSVVGNALGELASRLANWATEKVLDFAEWLGFDRATIEAGINEAIAGITAAAQRIIDIVKGIPSAVIGWVKDIFTMNEYSAEATAGFRSAGEQAGQALVDAVKNAVNSLIDWFKGLPGRIMAAIGRIDLSSLFSWPSLPSWLGGGKAAPRMPDGSLPEPNIAGALASGGPARAGRTYLVGERGMELFTPSVDGFVHNARDTTSMMRGGGNQISYAPVINVSVNGGPNLSARDIAQAINQELGRSLRNLEAGAFHDGVYA